MHPLDVPIGQRYGRLIVLAVAPSANRQARRLCHCDCGKEKVISSACLVRGKTVSCGCKRASGEHGTTHGMSKTREHAIWRAMLSRCSNPNVNNYSRYGGRGIRVCAVWRESFEAFYRDMGPRPSPHHSIERKNNDGNYEPDNCHWATKQEQSANRSNARMLTAGDVTLSLTEWAHRLGVDHTTILMRLRKGWTVERAVTEPVHHHA